MFTMLLFVILTLVSATSASIVGTSPPAGSCFCFTQNSVNVRSTACGAVIGQAHTGQCYTSKGGKVGCNLDKYYEFFEFEFGGGSGWAAGDFISLGSGCSSSTSEGYTCQISDAGRRIHEMTSQTPYDCRDNSCQNTCHGGQCVAYVTCRCNAPGTTNHPPGTSCWRPGTKVVDSSGKCNRNIPANTAIATFTSSGSYYAGHACVFIGCDSDYTIRVYDQWCCQSIRYSTFVSSHAYYNDYYVITNPGICSDRTSWPCRSEAAGPTCCPVSAGCLNKRVWW